jgi:hypothetical protein
MKRIIWAAAFILTFCIVGLVEAQDVPVPSFGLSDDAFPIRKPIAGTGMIDYENRLVRIVGHGTCDQGEDVSDAECLATAYAVAKSNGMQNLSEIVGQLKIGLDWTSNGINERLGKTVINSEAFLKGIREMRGEDPAGVKYKGYQYMSDQSIVAWVSLEMPLSGVELGVPLEQPEFKQLLKDRMAERAAEIKAAHRPVAPAPVGGPTPPDGPATATGLILNGSRFSSQPTVEFPVIMSEAGEKVYDPYKVMKSVRLNGEAFRYSASIEKAREYRDKVGADPIVLVPKNITRDGIFVLSVEDAHALASADQSGDFLRRGRVIIVYDSGKRLNWRHR